MTRSHRGVLHEAFFNGNGVAKKLIVALVSFSAVITALITAGELWLDYRRDLGQIERSIQFVRDSYRPTLTDSVWVADREQVQTQIEGLLRLPDVEYVGIVVDGQPRWQAGRAVSRRTVRAEVPLEREHRGQSLTIGTVQVVASVDRVLGRLWDRLLVTLVSNGVRTVLVAGFMLLVFQWLVTRHLSHIAGFLRTVDPTVSAPQRLELDRAPAGRWRPDILDAVAASVNALTASLAGALGGLRASELRLRALTQHAAAFIYEIDRSGRIAFVNRTYPGVTREQVEGTLLTSWFPPPERPAVAAAILRAFDEERVQHLQYEIPDPDGTPRAYLAAISPLPANGVMAERRAALTAIEITDQKAAERAVRELATTLELRVQERTRELQQALERAESASRAKSEFLSRMSHELRTPMNAVLGFAQIIEMSQPTPQQLKWAGEIRRAGSHLMQMIEDLLDLARIEVGKLALRPEPVEVAPALAEALALVRPMIDERGLALEVDAAADAGMHVLADRLRLRQVLLNLLSNAVKYNRPGGRIGVTWERRADRVRISVSDTGPGLSAAQREALFRPFERLGAEGGPVQGTGIGLALSAQLAAMMGATLGVDSEPGQGSTFSLELEVADGAAAADGPGPTTRTSPAQAADATPVELLYVEDNASNVAVVEAFLAAHPTLRLRVATDGAAALALVRQRRPDLLLLDLQLPGSSGHEVLQRLRAVPGCALLPAVAISAQAMPADVATARAAGFDRFLPKPLDLEELLRVIRALTAPRR